MMPATPWTAAVSNVSMDWSRWGGLLAPVRGMVGSTAGKSHVESCQVLPVLVEGLVVELGELL